MTKEFHMMNKREATEVMSMYFNVVRGSYLKDALDSFARKEGYGQEVILISFDTDLDDYDQAQLPKLLDKKHVLLELDYPAVEKDQIAYLDFRMFYEYLALNIVKIGNDSENKELLKLLTKVKNGLNV
ncbi:hypothetical protein [Lactiplantibacillus pingfangensis]|uniref:hypothetical protein n=1 Tax=Lactiplantibacillus pingfangensis TaxID=2559915 RepID=UPI0010F502E6|nr:hypothetical protein [Lactiplantibacillus pingfangensis]